MLRTALHVASLRAEKNMSKRAHTRFLFFTQHIFIRPTGKRKRKERSDAVNDEILRGIIFSRFSESFLTTRTLAIRVIAPTNGERESVLQDNPYEGLIVSINEPRLAESSQTSTINGASAFCTAIEKRDIKVKWNCLKLRRISRTLFFFIILLNLERNVKSYNG